MCPGIDVHNTTHIMCILMHISMYISMYIDMYLCTNEYVYECSCAEDLDAMAATRYA